MPLLATIRATIILAFKALPLLLISFIGFLALGLGNLSLFMLFIGHATVVPILTELAHMGFSKNNTGNLVTPNDISQLVPLVPTTGASYNTPTNVMPTYWMAHMWFFFGYILSNAVSIYTLSPAKGASEWMVESRKTRAATVITTTVILSIVFSYLRYSLTGTETPTGVAFAAIAVGGAGAAWYFAAAACGASNADIFGVVTQMSSQDSAQDKPMTCVYAPGAKSSS